MTHFEYKGNFCRMDKNKHASLTRWTNPTKKKLYKTRTIMPKATMLFWVALYSVKAVNVILHNIYVEVMNNCLESFFSNMPLVQKPVLQIFGRCGQKYSCSQSNSITFRRAISLIYLKEFVWAFSIYKDLHQSCLELSVNLSQLNFRILENLFFYFLLK